MTPANEFFNSYAAFLLGAPSQFGVSNFVTTPSIRQTQWGIWAGDHLNLMSRLSIDLGVRWEVYTPLEPRNATLLELPQVAAEGVFGDADQAAEVLVREALTLEVDGLHLQLYPGMGVVKPLMVQSVDLLGSEVDVDHRRKPG